jgi:hypothetical protein
MACLLTNALRTHPDVVGRSLGPVKRQAGCRPATELENILIEVARISGFGDY